MDKPITTVSVYYKETRFVYRRIDVLNVYSFYYIMKGRINIMKIMISQPMRGKTNEQIREERTKLILKLESEGHEVIDTVLDISENKSPIYYLAKSIELLDKADAVVFMPGWQQARGCKIEHEVAVEYGKQVFYEN